MRFFLMIAISLLVACGGDKPHKPPVYQSARTIDALDYPADVEPLPRSRRYVIPDLPQDKQIATPYDERDLVNPPDLLGDLLPESEQSARQQ